MHDCHCRRYELASLGFAPFGYGSAKTNQWRNLMEPASYGAIANWKAYYSRVKS